MRKKILIIVGIVLFVAMVGTDVYIQYKNINYNNEYKKTKNEISVLSKKVETLKVKETALETNFNTSKTTLDEMKVALTTLETNLAAATEKLNSLK